MATKTARPITPSASGPTPRPAPPAARADDPRSGKSEERGGKLHRMPRTLAGTPLLVDDSKRQSLLELYGEAIRLMQSNRYQEAHAAFDHLLHDAPHDLADRIRMYIAACVAQIHQGTSEFRSHEERYDYAISLLNHGHYEDAREHFNQILLDQCDCDYAFYGLALLSSMTKSSHECLDHLEQAIRLNPQNRIQARSDSDFANMSDDPRFTELLYPEA